MYLPTSDAETSPVRVAVAATAFVDNDGAGGGRQPGAGVLRIVVGDDHLAGDAVGIEHIACPAHTFLDVLLLVEARDDDRDDEAVVSGH